MFSNKTDFLWPRQLAAWSALAMLFVQPFGMNTFACSCSLVEAQAVESKAVESLNVELTASCCNSQPNKESQTTSCCTTLAEACCCPAKDKTASDKENISCRSITSCCGASEPVGESGCNCGESCSCSKIEQPESPQPIIPSRQSHAEESQLKAFEEYSFHYFGSPVEQSGEGWQKLHPIFSRTSLEKCALLSRFQC